MGQLDALSTCPLPDAGEQSVDKITGLALPEHPGLAEFRLRPFAKLSPGEIKWLESLRKLESKLRASDDLISTLKCDWQKVHGAARFANEARSAGVS